MTLGDLETVVQYKLPIKIIVFNNRSLGMVKLEMEVDGLPDWQTNMLNPDFAQVAEAMGMTGFNVSNPEEVLTTLLNAFELDGPVLVNIMTDPNALAMPPKIELGQMVGFAQSMYKLLINGPGPACALYSRWRTMSWVRRAVIPQTAWPCQYQMGTSTRPRAQR